MSDSLEPPAKRARLEADADASHYGAAFDAPGSPVDDMDDDFYDNTPVKPAHLPAGNTLKDVQQAVSFLKSRRSSGSG